MPKVTIPDIVLYEGLSFGEMLDAGWNWGQEVWASRTSIYSLTQGALDFFAPIITAQVEHTCWDLWPGDDRPDHFSRNLIREIQQATNQYGPILMTLFLSDTLQDGSAGDPGVINIQDDGQQGHREATLNTEFPQTMLLNNVQDYGSSGQSVSYGTQNYQGNLEAVDTALGAPDDPGYEDVINLICQRVMASGIFSVFSYWSGE